MNCPHMARGSAYLLFFVLMSSKPVHTQTADDVINRHIEAIGGHAAVRAIETMKYERVYVHLDEERIYHRVVHKKRPGQSRNCALDTGRCLIVDGNRSWAGEVNPEDGSVEWTEGEYLGSQSNNFEVRFGPFIDYREKGITVEFIGTETIEGVTMHRLGMQMRNGGSWDIYFDVETGLWSRFRTPGGGTVTIHDYRPVDGILFPRLTDVKGVRRDGTPVHHLNAVISLEVNVPMDDSLFRPGPRTSEIGASRVKGDSGSTAGGTHAVLSRGFQLIGSGF